MKVELHELIYLKIDQIIDNPSNRDSRGKLLISLEEEQSTSTTPTMSRDDDDHSRFLWVLMEESNMLHDMNDKTLMDEWEEKCERTELMTSDLITAITQDALALGYKLLTEPDTLAVFLLSQHGDTLTITVTDFRIIISLIYSGRY